MSSIGGACDRALWLSFRGFPENPTDGRMIMLFRFGDRIEEEVIQWLNAAGYRVEGQQDEFSDFDGHFRGHCDGIVHGVTSRPHILEVKSANANRFKAFKMAGIEKTSNTYFAQAQCYMGYSGLDRTLFVVQDKNTSEIYTERIRFSKLIFDELRERAKAIIYSDDIPSLRAEHDMACRWCSQSMSCAYADDGEGLTLADDQVCGTCKWFGHAKGLKKWCHHHDLEIKTWGVGCPDWKDRFEKDLITKDKASDKPA